MNDNVIPLRREGANEPEPHVPVLSTRQQALILMQAAKERGATWREVADMSGRTHGSVSAVLSTMHKAGMIERLSLTRAGCKVYVMPDFVDGRRTEKQGKGRDYLLYEMAKVLRQVPTKCKHSIWVPNCRSCEIRDVLAKYDRR